MSYRPTVRYGSHQQQLINELYKQTKIDRAKIIRCALHVAAHQPEFYRQLGVDVPPSPAWELGEPLHWKELLTDEQIEKLKEEGGTSHGKPQVSDRRQEEQKAESHTRSKTSEGETKEIKIKYTGGIKLHL